MLFLSVSDVLVMLGSWNLIKKGLVCEHHRLSKSRDCGFKSHRWRTQLFKYFNSLASNMF